MIYGFCELEYAHVLVARWHREGPGLRTICIHLQPCRQLLKPFRDVSGASLGLRFEPSRAQRAQAPGKDTKGKVDEKDSRFAYAAAGKVVAGIREDYATKFGRVKGRNKLSDEEQKEKEEMQNALDEARSERAVSFEVASTQSHRI